MLGLTKTTIFGALALCLTTAAAAEPVKLITLDGSVTLSGEFVDFDGEQYKLQTIFGELVVDAFQVRCEGADCPAVQTGPSEYGISGSASIVGSLFGELMQQFSLDIGGDILTSIGTDGRTQLKLLNEVGQDLASVLLTTEGSTKALEDLISGTVSLAVTSRGVRAGERDDFLRVGLGDLSSQEQEKIFALDGLVVVTSQNNPVRAIAEEDVSRIFSGEISNWAQIGGPSAPIKLYVRDADSGTGSVFYDLVMNPASARLSGGASFYDSDEGVSNAVAGDPLGIGFTSMSSVRNAKVLAIRGVCGIQVPATPFTVKTEEYPLSRRLYTYKTNEETPAHLNRFLDFLDTDSAQEVIASAGYVDLGVSYQSNNEQGLRYLSAVMPTDVEVNLPQLRAMTQELMSADRLSITYRFALGSTVLDARALDDIERLAKLLSTGDITNKELLLIGFTDSVGVGDRNLALSRERAIQVREALVAAAPPGSLDTLPIQTLGFGEISPLSCNENANGRRINRRVEVWLRDMITTSR